MKENFRMLAKTFYGFEPILAQELKQLGAMKVKEGLRNVSFEGDLGFLYKANLSLRTALKILVPVYSFSIHKETDLYKKLLQFRWEKWLATNNTFAIQSVVNSDLFNHSHYVSLKCKDAIVDYFRDRYNDRPNIDLKHPDVQINVHIQRNRCTISIDSSGESLHKRGYRRDTNIAPINEVLAAGLLKFAGYDGSQNLIDPMCGSGTILIEAAMMANHIPANINRLEFAFEKWPNYDDALFDVIQNSLLKKVRESSKKILGFDRAPSAVRKAQDNIKQANLEEFIQVDKQDFFESSNPLPEENLMLVFNPPYGERLKVNVSEFYGEIGNTLKQGYTNTTAWLITSDFEYGLKHVGLRTSKKIKLFNSNLESRLVRYDMYKGSKKVKKHS